MRENDAGRSRDVWRSHPFLKRITGLGARVSAAILLATGVVGGLAARRNKPDDSGNGKGGDSGGQARDSGKNRDRDGKSEDGRTAERGQDARTSDRSARDDRHSGNDRSAAAEDPAKSRRRGQDSANRDENADVEAEAKNTPTPATPTPADNAAGGGGKGDSGGGGGDGGSGSGGGGRAGNAGSDFFDSPLATKARRRADEFGNRDGEPGNDGIVVDVDPERESVYQTDGISFTTGPEGVEILTGNITFTAAPTPIPTPFPRLELPAREGLVPGDVLAAPPTTAPSDGGAPAPAPARSEPARSDPGDGNLQPDAAAPVPPDTSGGDNTMDFTS